MLASLLGEYRGRTDVVVLGLPRGGVPVAAEVATALGAPLDVCVVRKLGVPRQPELAMGAIAGGGVRILNDALVVRLGISQEEIDTVVATEAAELQRRLATYRGDRPPVDVAGRVAVLVDDGLATGSTMLAAVAAVRLQRPAAVTVAVPVGAPPTCTMLTGAADTVVCARSPRRFRAVGEWYRDFTPPTDDDIRALLAGQR